MLNVGFYIFAIGVQRAKPRKFIGAFGYGIRYKSVYGLRLRRFCRNGKYQMMRHARLFAFFDKRLYSTVVTHRYMIKFAYAFNGFFHYFFRVNVAMTVYYGKHNLHLIYSALTFLRTALSFYILIFYLRRSSGTL